MGRVARIMSWSVYRAIENNVYVLLIADGRRDMQTLLQRRLLQA